MSYWLDGDEGDQEDEYVDASLFVDVHQLVDPCGDRLVTDQRVVYECGRDLNHPGRHAFIDLVGEDPVPVVLAAWPSAHRPDADDAERMPS